MSNLFNVDRYPGWTQQRENDLFEYRQNVDFVSCHGVPQQCSSICLDLLEKYQNDNLFLYLSGNQYVADSPDVHAFVAWNVAAAN